LVKCDTIKFIGSARYAWRAYKNVRGAFVILRVTAILNNIMACFFVAVPAIRRKRQKEKNEREREV
jgi:hypothetical protein